jgi:hypothetical protein
MREPIDFRRPAITRVYFVCFAFFWIGSLVAIGMRSPSDASLRSSWLPSALPSRCGSGRSGSSQTSRDYWSAISSGRGALDGRGGGLQVVPGSNGHVVHACHSRASSNASPRDSIRRIGRGRSSLTIARRRSDPSPRGARRARPRRDQSPQAASWPYKIPMGRVSVFKSGWGRPAYSWSPTCPPSEVIQPRKCLGSSNEHADSESNLGRVGNARKSWAIVGTLASNRVRSSSSAGSDCAA